MEIPLEVIQESRLEFDWAEEKARHKGDSDVEFALSDNRPDQQGKGIDPQIVVHAIEDAIVVASRKYFKSNEELKGRINPDTGEIDVYALRKVVEDVTNPVREISLDEARQVKPDAKMDEEIEFLKPPSGSAASRLSWPSRSSFRKSVRPSAKASTPNTTKHVGEIVNCVVKRFENGDIIVELGKTKAPLAKRDQSKLESFARTSAFACVITKVDKTAKGPRSWSLGPILCSCSISFQTEVPEIYDGTVQIRSIAREAGERTKIAVTSRERDVDPVGACVGMKGTRVQSIIRELRGEKIDIIPVERRFRTFATNAISPRKSAAWRLSTPRQDHGNGGRRQSAVARHRQEGTKRSAGIQTHRLAHRYQERRGKNAPKSKAR
jgi:N utilization substance protein A